MKALVRYSEECLRAMMFRAWLYRITLNAVRNRLRQDREVAVGETLVRCWAFRALDLERGGRTSWTF